MLAAVEREAEALHAEFLRPGGPRGARGSAPVDLEMEERLRARLQALVPCAWVGEECGAHPAGGDDAHVWVVDPHDGTHEFLSGRRGSAISVALLRGQEPVLAVVCSPLSPDLGHDTLAWEEGGPLLRNGERLACDLSRAGLRPGALVWATASSALRPETFSRLVAPARYVAMPSIAYRLARVAAGDGVAAISLHPVNEYDIAAGLALVRAAGGIAVDAQGKEIVLTGACEARLSGCFAGAPEAVRRLAAQAWSEVDQEPRRERRVAVAFPRRAPAGHIERAQGCLLGQVLGDAIAASGRDASGPRDGGTFHTIAGQPTNDGELAIVLARSLAREKAFSREKILAAYRAWLVSRPFELGSTTEKGLLGHPDAESQSNGSLVRVAPLGAFAAGDPERAAEAAREESLLTHPHPVCLEACAGYAAALAAGIAGGGRRAMLDAALLHSTGAAREAIERGASGTLPGDFETRQGWVLVALQNGFCRLTSSEDFPAAILESVRCGGDARANAAIAGALVGAADGRAAVPPPWILALLSCRPLVEARAPRPRPMDYWPDDLLELAEALLEK